MNRFILQQDKELTIYRNAFGLTYTVVTPKGEASGKTIKEAIDNLSNQAKPVVNKSKNEKIDTKA